MTWDQNRLGRSNSSPAFLSCIEDVAAIVRNARVGDDPAAVARTIMAHLVHRRGIGPPAIEGGANRAD